MIDNQQVKYKIILIKKITNKKKPHKKPTQTKKKYDQEE